MSASPVSVVLDQPILRSQMIPLSVEAYNALGEMGFIEEKSELIRGYILAKMPKSPRHRIICQRLMRHFLKACGDSLSVWQEQALVTHDSEPEPDIAITRGGDESFARSHPRTAALVVEVSLSTIERDLEKTFIYAEAGVEEYWLIRPDEGVADVYTQPGPGGYASVKRIDRDGVLTPAVLPAVSIRMEELLA